MKSLESLRILPGSQNDQEKSMTARKKFGLADLDGALEEVGNRIGRPVKAFLIGGCAMAYMGSKLSTKDVDVVLLSEKDVEAFGKALKAAGFNIIRSSTQEYENLGSQMMFRNADEMQFDVFGRTVCRKLEVSNRMASRSSMLKAYGKLEIRLISPEDIFLFKGMTERDGDLDDMALLAERGLRWDVIKEECMLQKKRQTLGAFPVCEARRAGETARHQSPYQTGAVEGGRG